MKHTVGVAEMKIATQSGDILFTPALGSCVGIAAYDPEACVGGLYHAMLPSFTVNPEKARDYPMMYIDLGTPYFFKALYKKGADKNRLIIKVAGGASFTKEGKEDFFNIGEKNLKILHKLFYKNGIKVHGQDVGGRVARAMYLKIGTGKIWVQKDNKIQEL